MHGRDILTVGASAGGVEALARLVSALPPDLPAAAFIVLHIPASATSHLPDILDRSGPLPATHARDGEAIRNGCIYVAPPDHHLLIEQGITRVVFAATENRHRPAADPLMRSAAIAYGPRVVGVVLSGSDGDGTAGLRAIKRRGGIAVIQDPAEALFSGMPESARSYVDIDYQLPVSDIAGLLAKLARTAAESDEVCPVPEALILEQKQMTNEQGSVDLNRFATISEYTCPECDGPLWEIRDGDFVRYRCRVGHTFTAGDMVAARSEQLEHNLWTTLNQLEESISLSSRLAQEAQTRGYERAAASFEEKAERARRRADLIRQALEDNELANIPLPASTGMSVRRRHNRLRNLGTTAE